MRGEAQRNENAGRTDRDERTNRRKDVKYMPFTKAELEEMRLADEEIERKFAAELAAYKREYREANRDKIAAYKREYYEARKARTTACVQ